jgi:antitoxin VapB
VRTRRVRIFRNGRNQAVRIPREFELPGDEAIMTRDGDRLILEPPPREGLLAVLARLTDDELPVSEDRALAATLVTDNERAFGRISDLSIENWLR